MRLFAVALTLCLVTPLPLSAAPQESPLRASAEREARRLAAPFSQQQSDKQAAEKSGWISRHPALFGALVGAGAGAVTSMAMDNEWFCSGGDEDCFFHGGSRVLVGAGIGAGVGALVGWVAGAARGDGKSHLRTSSRDRQIAGSPNS